MKNNEIKKNLPHTDFFNSKCTVMDASKIRALNPFSDRIVHLDIWNHMGIESAQGIQLRIDWVTTTDSDSFNQMMEYTIQLAEKEGFKKIIYVGKLSLMVKELFISYGFIETHKDNSDGSLFLEYNLSDTMATITTDSEKN